MMMIIIIIIIINIIKKKRQKEKCILATLCKLASITCALVWGHKSMKCSGDRLYKSSEGLTGSVRFQISQDKPANP